MIGARRRSREAGGASGREASGPVGRETGRDASRDDDGGGPPIAIAAARRRPGARRYFASTAKQTTPPPRYTDATLLGAMESAGKAIDDEALRQAMKDCGLGTPATRAAIIETLLRRTYIERARQNLVPTVGIALIDALPVASLASPELTGSWEARLARIARGDDSRAAFMTDIARYVTDIIDAIRGAAPPDAPPLPPVGGCPRCGGEVSADRRAYACGAGCGFAMPNRVAGRAIGAPLAGVLLARGRSQVLRGFRSKAGKRFSAVLVLEPDGKLRFDFGQGNRHSASHDNAAPRTSDAPSRDAPSRDASSRNASSRDASSRDTSARKRSRGREAKGIATKGIATKGIATKGIATKGIATKGIATKGIATKGIATEGIATTNDAGVLTCPKCRQGTLIAGSRGWGCSRWREGCPFVVWFETSGKRVTAAQLRDLVTRGKTRQGHVRRRWQCGRRTPRARPRCTRRQCASRAGLRRR